MISSRARRGISLTAALLVLLLAAPAGGFAETITPLPASDYTVSSACPVPAPGQASCLALALIPTTSAARARTHPLGMTRQATAQSTPLSAAEGGYGFRPQDLQSAYFAGEAPDTPTSEPQQTIALVDAYSDFKAESDLAVYDGEFKLPACTTANGCFTRVNQNGSAEPSQMPFPASEAALEQREKTCKRIALETRAQRTEREAACAEVEAAKDWAIETATDIEVAHAVCQNCKILLVEASNDSYENLERAEETAVALGANEVSNSWGGEEPAFDSQVFDHPSTATNPGVVITAASGDDGYLNWDQYSTRNQKGSAYFEGADYPATSPHVVAVGGTRLTMSAGAWQSESVWNDGSGAVGGGCSERFGAPAWQLAVSDWSSVGCGGERSVADVAADADPDTGVAIYDSMPYESEKVITIFKWAAIGGTSVASPIIAAMYALAGGAHKLSAGSSEGEYPAQILYSHLGSNLLHDVSTGGSGQCKGEYSGGCQGSLTSPLDCGAGLLVCNAGAGYDGPTGVGTPNGTGAFKLGHQPNEVPETKTVQETAEQKAKASEEKGTSQPPPSEKTASPGETASNPVTGTPGSGNASSPPRVSIVVSPSSPSSTAPAHTGTRPATPALSALALTHAAVLALRHTSPLSSHIGFAFTLSVASSVSVAVYKQFGVSGHRRWRKVLGPITISGARGRNHRTLPGSHRLIAGRYLLKLTPSGGVPRSLPFIVG